MTTTTFALLKHFNGEVISTETRRLPRTLIGLRRMIANMHCMSGGWGLWLAPESREMMLTWVAAQLGGHDGDARRWFAERRVGGID